MFEMPISITLGVTSREPRALYEALVDYRPPTWWPSMSGRNVGPAARDDAREKFVVIVPVKQSVPAIMPSKSYHAALDDLKTIAEQAKDAEYPIPTRDSIGSAKLLLEHIQEHPKLAVYPCPDGAVGVSAFSVHSKTRNVAAVCAADGSVICSVQDENAASGAFSPDANDASMVAFLTKAVHNLGDPRD